MQPTQLARQSCAHASEDPGWHHGCGRAGICTQHGIGGKRGLTPLKPKTFSASTPMSGAPRAPIAPDAHLSKAYTDVLILSGTTCVGGFSFNALALCSDASLKGGGRAYNGYSIDQVVWSYLIISHWSYHVVWSPGLRRGKERTSAKMAALFAAGQVPNSAMRKPTNPYTAPQWSWLCGYPVAYFALAAPAHLN